MPVPSISALLCLTLALPAQGRELPSLQQVRSAVRRTFQNLRSLQAEYEFDWASSAATTAPARPVSLRLLMIAGQNYLLRAADAVRWSDRTVLYAVERLFGGPDGLTLVRDQPWTGGVHRQYHLYAAEVDRGSVTVGDPRQWGLFLAFKRFDRWLESVDLRLVGWDSIQGRSCLRLQAVQPMPTPGQWAIQPPPIHYSLWLDPEAGYMARQIEHGPAPGRPSARFVVSKFRPLEGFWLPAEGTYSVRNGDRWRQVGTLRLRPDSLRFNQPIDPTSLQIAPPPGSDVVDHRRQPPVRFEQPYRRDSQELALLIDQTDKRLEAIGPDPDVDQLRQAISQVAADRTFSDISRAAGRIRYGLFLFKTARKLLAKATDERLTMAAARQLSRAALNLYSLWPDTSLLDEANKLIRQTRRRIKDRRDTAELLSYELNLRACKKLRQTRLRTEAAQSIRAEAEGLLQLYPDSEALAMTLLRVAQDLYHVDPTARKLLTALQKTAPSTRAARLAAGLQRVAATIGKQIDLTLVSLDGTELSLAAFRGKVVLLHFFMVGSPGGGWNLPGLRELFRRYHHLGLELIGVSLDSDPQRLKRFLKRIDLPWPVCCDGKGWDSPAVLALGVSELPAIFIIDRAGRLRSAFLPDVSASLVAALLSEPPPAVTTTRAATRPATKPAATSAAAPAISQPTRR